MMFLALEYCYWKHRVKRRIPTSMIPMHLPLAMQVWNLWSDGRAWELKGPILENEASYPILKRYMNMVLLSVGENATDRPAMSELVSMHSNEVANLLSPKQPAFFISEKRS
ncbi:hypothetical protein CUMW_139940 [Citrus unshiu]|nr:hypothetical protein CUMW_139940 [Citrus unshiu]